MKKILKETCKLNNGIEMPMIGLGTYKMSSEQEAIDSVLFALENGYRHIDTAEIYGNHKFIAKALKQSSVPRKEIFITSKIWNDNSTYDETLTHFEQILKDLEIEYLDLCLVHWPTANSIECYKALEVLYKQGKVRAIGVSNFMIDQLQELLEQTTIVPAVNQVELHPQLPCLELQEYCNSKGIALESWQTIMKGQIFELPLFNELAKKYKVSEAQVALKWANQRGIIIIPKSVTPARIIENSQLDGFELTNEEIKAINELGPEVRLGGDPYKAW